MGGIACELFKTSYVHHNPRKRKPAYAFRVRDDMPWQSNADIFVSQVNHLPRLGKELCKSEFCARRMILLVLHIAPVWPGSEKHAPVLEPACLQLRQASRS